MTVAETVNEDDDEEGDEEEDDEDDDEDESDFDDEDYIIGFSGDVEVDILDQAVPLQETVEEEGLEEDDGGGDGVKESDDETVRNPSFGSSRDVVVAEGGCSVLETVVAVDSQLTQDGVATTVPVVTATASSPPTLSPMSRRAFTQLNETRI